MDKGRNSSRVHDNKRYNERRIVSSKKPKKVHYRSRDDRHHHSSSSLLKSDYRNYKIVEYSDVSSEDFSAPEAGEIEDEEIFTISDKETSFQGSNSNGNSLIAGSSHNRMLDDDMDSKMSRRDSEMSRLDFVMSPGQVRKVIIGSPISSSVSSNSRSKTRRSMSPIGHTNKKQDSGSRKHSDAIVVTVSTSVDGSSVSPIDDIECNENDEGLEEEDAEEDDEESERRRRKNKKSKKKKSKKKKKKRRKSISSISISDVDSLIDETQNETPPRPVSPWEKTYTPLKPSPLSPGPVTPPLRPSSTISMYSDDLHSGHGSRSRGGGGIGASSPPPLSVHRDKIYVSSPHTPPPIVPKKSYPNNDYHHQRHTHQPRSPPPTNRRSSKSPSKFSLYLLFVFHVTRYSSYFSADRRMVYSPQSHHNQRKRKLDRSYDRDHPHPSSKRDNHRSSRSDYDHYRNTNSSSSNSRRFSPSPQRSTRNRRPHSPASPPPPQSSRTHSIKRYSRSRSPRYGRASSPGGYYGTSRTSRARSPSIPAKSGGNSSRKVDFNNKISDTSLFAELVKDKHKRNKVLQELMDKQDENVPSGSENSNCAIPENTSAMRDDSFVPMEHSNHSNGTKDGCLLVDIPMPHNIDVIDGNGEATVTMTTALLPPPPPPSHPDIGDDIRQKTATFAANPSTPVIITTTPLPPLAAVPQIPFIKATYTISKSRNLTQLPMPPGVNMAELEDVSTPSPPRSMSPVPTRKSPAAPKLPQHQPSKDNATNSSKKGLLNLPMPPMVPGSEDLSGDDEAAGTPPNSRTSKKRPTILNRRNSRSGLIKDWGERCVDVFQVIAQIGEGTYGQVSNAPFTRIKCRYFMFLFICFRYIKLVTIQPMKWWL